jgi:hypothetical protein
MEGKVEVRNASGSAKVLAAGTYKDQTVEW